MSVFRSIFPKLNKLANRKLDCCSCRNFLTSVHCGKESSSSKIPNQEQIIINEQEEVDLFKEEWNFSDQSFDEIEKTMIKNAQLSEKNVFVIQPLVADAMEFTKSTSIDLQLSESIALVNSVPGWNVCGSMIAKTRSLKGEDIFDQITNVNIAERIEQSGSASTVFLSVNQLRTIQRRYLIKTTGLDDILDRYLLVLNIFKQRAKTKQAKMQVALAEIPYRRMMLQTDTSYNQETGGGGFSHIGGCGEKPWELARRRLKSQEQKIKKNLELLRRNRSIIRSSRKRTGVPTVAVVGYTNAGKTTLIKALSGSDRLVPQNRLFATLDVTAHAVTSQDSKIKYIMIDTVGFLSNLPHLLIDAFKATMEDMLQADVIVHVCDVSHPDRAYQRENVIKLLRSLDVPLKTLKNIIEVHNKTDLVSSRERERLGSTGVPQICATNGDGLKELQTKIDKRIIEITKSETVIYRVPAMGEHLSWLEENAYVRYVIGDGNYHLHVETIIPEAMANKFAANFTDVEILNNNNFKET